LMASADFDREGVEVRGGKSELISG
jgi:hypothetical protein